MAELVGKCFCGACQYRASKPILWAALCHCEDCRRAASADYVSWLGVNRSTVKWSGPRVTYKSSSKVVRSYCGECGAPLSFETKVFPEETHLYAPTLLDHSVYSPTAHIFWSEKLPWVNVRDDLPKHLKGLQDAASKGETLL